MNGSLLKFSRAQLTDRDELTELLMLSFDGMYTLAETQPDVDLSFTNHIFAYHFFIGKEAGRVVCAGALKKSGLEKDVWGIAWVSVLPSRQKLGYGRRIVEFLLDCFAREFVKTEQGTILLSSKKHNFSFYDRLGFAWVDANNGSRLYFKTVNRINKEGLVQA